MYSRAIALEISLMEPYTIIGILKLKLHLGNKRNGGNTNKILKAYEQLEQIEARKNISFREDPKNRY